MPEVQITYHNRPDLLGPLEEGIITVPEDETRAAEYYLLDGKVIPTDNFARYFAENLMDGVMSEVALKGPDEPRRLLLRVTTDQPGSIRLMQEVEKVAVERGFTDISYTVRTPQAERERVERIAKIVGVTPEKTREKRLAAIKQDYIYGKKGELDSDEQPLTEDGEYWQIHDADAIILVRDSNLEASDGLDPEILGLFVEARADADRMRVDQREWNLSTPPHPSLAARDSEINQRTITEEDEWWDYIQHCRVDAKKVLVAQEKLAGIIGKARRLRIVTHFEDPLYASDIVFTTLRNSYGHVHPRRPANHAGLKHNFPGPEVFFAPSSNNPEDGEFGGFPETVSGRMGFPGGVTLNLGGRSVFLRNLWVEFVNGEVVDWDIVGNPKDSGIIQEKAWFQTILDSKGGRRLGEIGLGTSRFPKFLTAEIGRGEKNKPHFALGKSYADQVDETGKIAELDNGNTNATYHCDLMLPISPDHPGELYAEVDTGRKDIAGNPIYEWILIQKNGRYMERVEGNIYRRDPDLSIISIDDEDVESFEVEIPLEDPYTYRFWRNHPQAIRRTRQFVERFTGGKPVVIPTRPGRRPAALRNRGFSQP